jgi:hypothetical protein
MAWKCWKCGAASYHAWGNSKKGEPTRPWCAECFERDHPELIEQKAEALSAGRAFVKEKSAH